jgi:DNA-entry nuclease
MLPFEIRVAEYIESTGNHVRYRVTPVFAGDDLVASGVLMEACSVEDSGAGVRFCVYCYNVQPGVAIDYATGESRLTGDETTCTETTAETTETTLSAPAERTLPATEAAKTDYVLNTNTKRFHLPDCPSVGDIKTRNREDYSGSRDALIADGYVPCQRCNP